MSMKFKPLCTDESAKATLWQTSCAIAGPFLEANDGESDAGPGDAAAIVFAVIDIHVNDGVYCVSPPWTLNLHLADGGAAASAVDAAWTDGGMRLRMNLTAMFTQTIYSRQTLFCF